MFFFWTRRGGRCRPPPPYPGYEPLPFVAHRVQHSHCSPIFIDCSELTLSRFPLKIIFARKIPREYALGETRTHEINLDRHADHLPSHRGRRLCASERNVRWNVRHAQCVPRGQGDPSISGNTVLATAGTNSPWYAVTAAALFAYEEQVGPKPFRSPRPRGRSLILGSLTLGVRRAVSFWGQTT